MTEQWAVPPRVLRGWGLPPVTCLFLMLAATSTQASGAMPTGGAAYNQVLIAFVLLLAIIIWNVLLNRRLQVQTRHLRAEIEHRRRQEEELRLSKERLQLAIRAGNIGIWDWNVADNTLTWDDSMYRLYGIDREEFAGDYDAWRQTLHPQDAPQVEAEVRAALAGERGYAPEFRVIRGDGSVRFIQAAAQIYHDREGAPLRMIGINLDITERKQVAEALSRADQVKISILESITDAFFSLDNDMVVTYFNHAAEKALGKGAAEVIGRRLFDVFPQARGSIFEHQYAQALREKKALMFETYFGYAPYDDWYDVRVFPFESGISVYFQIITERKEAEAAMRESERAKSALLGELMDRNAELERFTYTVSHDLKSPLITIKGFAGALARDLERGNHERMAEDIRRIGTAADRMKDLLRDLLQLARVGRVVSPAEEVDMNTLVPEVLAQLAGPVQAAGVEVVVQPDLPTMHCDRLRLFEVVQNLVENAIKYRGGAAAPRIEIGCRTEEDGRQLLFVRDNGMGIEKQYHENIFGLFNKLDANSEGTGIGLALVKRIVEVHGGSCWVESEGVGKGSTFCFSLAPR